LVHVQNDPDFKEWLVFSIPEGSSGLLRCSGFQTDSFAIAYFWENTSIIVIISNKYKVSQKPRNVSKATDCIFISPRCAISRKLCMCTLFIKPYMSEFVAASLITAKSESEPHERNIFNEIKVRINGTVDGIVFIQNYDGPNV